MQNTRKVTWFGMEEHRFLSLSLVSYSENKWLHQGIMKKYNENASCVYYGATQTVFLNLRILK